MMGLLWFVVGLFLGIIWGAQSIIDSHKKKAVEGGCVEFDGKIYKYMEVVI